MNKNQIAAGVTAASAGNHAIGVAYAAAQLNTSAKLVMPRSTPKIRVETCIALGAEVVLANDLAEAYEQVADIERQEGRFLVHQFEGAETVLGTATLGYEWAQQCADLDAVIVPIGGGGLFAGISTAFKHLQPLCKLYGVEPEGSDVINQSLSMGSLQKLDGSATIADSLAVPQAQPYTTAICRQNLERLVLVSDAELKRSMALLFHSMKLAVEPAAAAATAALIGPLREELEGKRVGVLVCGTNIDSDTFSKHIAGL